MHYLQFLFFFCKIEQEHKDICEIIWMQNISRFISFSNLLHFSWQHFVCVCGKKHNMRSTLITNVWVYSTLLLNISQMLYIGSLGLFHLAWYWNLIPYSPQPLATTIPLSDLMSSTTLGTSYKCNYTVFSLRRLAYFPLHDVFRVHPCSIWQNFLLFYCRIIFHYMYRPHFLHPLIPMDRLFPTLSYCEQWCNEHENVSIS